MTRSVIATVIALALVAASGNAAGSAEPAPGPLAGSGFFEVGVPILLKAGVAEEDGLPPIGVRSPGGVALATGPTVDLRLEAADLLVERTSLQTTVIEHPTSSSSRLFEYSEDDAVTTTDRFTDAAVLLTRAGAEATAFTYPAERGAPGAHEILLTRDDGGAAVIAARDASFAPYRPDVQAGDADPSDMDMRLHYTLDAPHFQTHVEGGRLAVTGDFAVFLWDADFQVGTTGAMNEYQTGRERSGDGPAFQETTARAVLLVQDGTLTLTTTEPALVAGPEFAAAVVGTVDLPTAVGGFSAGGDTYEATGGDLQLTGDVTLKLTLLDRQDRVLASVAGTLDAITLTATKPVDRATVLGVSPAVAATGGALILAAAAVLVARRRDDVIALVRARGDDDAEAAVFALERGDDAAAVKHFQKALKATPDDVRLLVGFGVLQMRCGRLREGRDQLEHAVRAGPDNAEAHFYYSQALAELGLLTSAFSHLSRALLLDPRLAEQARAEASFAAFRDHPRFLALVG